MVDMFTQGRIGGMDLKNRIVRSATWEALADDGGKPTDMLVKNAVARVEGGVGLHVMGITAVSPEGKGMPGMAGIFSDEQAKAHKRLVEAVHEAGGKVCLQIAHVGGQTMTDTLPGKTAVGPSAVMNPAFKTMPRALATDEVKGLVDAFGKAARRAREAGYDAVQIHAAHGYLIDQFMSPLFNRRDDEYGDPHLFAMEVYRAAREMAGNLSVLVKLSLHDYLEGSTTPDIALPLAKKLAQEGIDAIEVSGGTVASGKLNPSRLVRERAEEGYLLDLAKMVKSEVACPVITVGGYRSPDIINKALAEGHADFVAISRPLIREPSLINRWKSGDLRPAECVSCCRCFGTLKYGEGIQCKLEYKKRMAPEG